MAAIGLCISVYSRGQRLLSNRVWVQPCNRFRSCVRATRYNLIFFFFLPFNIRTGSSGDGLSAGAQAGIAVAVFVAFCFVCIVILVAIVVVIFRKRLKYFRRMRDAEDERANTVSF